MAIDVIQERVSGSRDTFRIPYYVYDTDGPGNIVLRDDAVLAALNQAQIDVGVPADNYTDEQLSDHAYRVVAMYEYKRLEPPEPPEIGVKEYRMSWTAPAYIMRYRRGDAPIYRAPTNAPLFGNAVGTRPVGSGKHNDHQGIPIEAGRPSLDMSIRTPNANVSDSYIRLIESLRGHVNSAPFLGRAAGEVRFVAYQIFRSSNSEFSISLGFEHRPVRFNVQIPNTTGVIPELYGFDEQWSIDNRVEVETPSGTVDTAWLPKYVYIERPDEWSNLNLIADPILQA